MTTNSTPLPTRDPSVEQTRGRDRGRVYRGPSFEEVIPMIQADLGPDAIVLGRRAGLTGGIGGFFQRRFVEIEAEPSRPGIDVYDEDAATRTPPEAAPAHATAESSAAAESPFSRPAAETELAEDFRELLAPTLGTAAAESHGGLSAGSFAAALASAETDDTMTQALSANGSRGAAYHQHGRPLAAPTEGARDTAEQAQSDARETPANGAGGAVSHRHSDPQTAPANGAGAGGRARAPIERSLLGSGMSEELVGELIDGASAHLVPLAPRVGLARAVRIALERRIPTLAPLPAAGGMIALVGPGGSGKTGCCIALIGAYRKSGRLPASCATLVRGGEGPLELLLSPHVLTPVPATAASAARALANSRSGGLTILDTPPLSSGDRAAIRDMATLTKSLRPERVVVALPATLGAAAAAQLLGALRPLGASAVAITHADETDQLGVAVEAACRFGLAPEYMLERVRGRCRLTRVDAAQLAQRLLG